MTKETPAVIADSDDTTPIPGEDQKAPETKAEQKQEAAVDPAPNADDDAKEAEAASEAAKTLADRKRSARERVQQAVARQREAERLSAEKDKVIAELRARLKEPDPASYDDNAKYTADFLDHRLNERELKQAEADKASTEQARIEAIGEAYRERVAVFSSTTPDYEDVAHSAPISKATALLIAEMEEAPEVAYALGKNHAEARRIDRLPERLRAVELGKIAARLSQPAPSKITKAPEPITSIAGRGSVPQIDPGRMSYKEFKVWREKGKAT